MKDPLDVNAWEFPGGKVEVGESLEEALIRELNEELEIEIKNPIPLMSLQHKKKTGEEWNLTLFVVEIQDQGWVLHEHLEACWIEASNLPSVAFMPTNRLFIQPLLFFLKNRISSIDNGNSSE